jgi:hypothetical protein
MNCRRAVPVASSISPKDGRPNQYRCRRDGETYPRFGSCEHIWLKFTPPDYAAIQRESAAYAQAQKELRAAQGPNGPLDDAAHHRRAMEILQKMNAQHHAERQKEAIT